MTEGRAIAVEDKDPDADYAADFAALIARMERWAWGMTRFPQNVSEWFANEKIPAESWLVSPPIVTAEVQRRCAQAVLYAAANLARVKPPEAATARTAAIVDYPNMFGSEVCVFFDPGYWEMFAARDEDDYRWKPLPESYSLAQRLGLTVPEGFVERGYHTWWRDDDEPPQVFENETWIYHERLAGE